jgi:hypothetical protein
MAETPVTQSQIAKLEAELDALRIVVKALAEIAEQPHLQPAIDQHIEEKLHSMQSAGKSAAEITVVVEAVTRLRESI